MELYSDMRRGDGAKADLSFTFRCDIQVSFDDPLDIASDDTDYAVDLSSWRDNMAKAPDDHDFSRPYRSRHLPSGPRQRSLRCYPAIIAEA